MALLVVGYIKSRPGSTTTALGLAAVLPEQARPIVVECDPGGGDLAARHGLTVDPGVVELATATRTATRPSPIGHDEVLSRFAQPVAVGERQVDVVAAPSGGAQTRVALSVLAQPEHRVLTGAGRLVIADCGRLDFGSPARPLLGAADAVLVLARGRLDEVAHLREHAPILATAVQDRLIVVLAAGGTYRAHNVAEQLASGGDALPVCGTLPYDERSAAVLEGQRKAGRRWRRWPLFAALDQLATATNLASKAAPPPAARTSVA
jgi:hypothetical protein